ncbi:MAG TPA: hemolysin III family protein [Gemmatimonadaceae bacterium]|nr:hemolysin III family protein [Gemmatimonadaceae bacterium]
MKPGILTSQRRAQSLGEEIANSITHGLGLVASLIALPILVLSPSTHRDSLQLIGVAVFAATLILLYSASTIYHATPPSPRKKFLRAIDHGAIYLLIAGTYTPFTLGALRGPVGWTILITIWALAILGIVAKSIYGFRYPRISTAFYLGMGWLIVLAVRPLILHVPRAGLLWILAGGLCYTVGVVFYATDARVKYGHAIWHLFVAGGSVCHFFAVLWYSAPAVE